MKINMDALKALELKLAEYSKANGAIVEHESANVNCSSSCMVTCNGNCQGCCYHNPCGGACAGTCRGTAN